MRGAGGEASRAQKRYAAADREIPRSSRPTTCGAWGERGRLSVSVGRWLKKCERLYQGTRWRPAAAGVASRSPTAPPAEWRTSSSAAACDQNNNNNNHTSIRTRRDAFRDGKSFDFIFTSRYRVFTTVFGKRESPFSCVFRNFFKPAIRSPCVAGRPPMMTTTVAVARPASARPGKPASRRDPASRRPACKPASRRPPDDDRPPPAASSVPPSQLWPPPPPPPPPVFRTTNGRNVFPYFSPHVHIRIVDTFIRIHTGTIPRPT